jgi:hypothetical protein
MIASSRSARRQRPWLVLASCLSALVTSPAVAQQTSELLAESLFDEGKALLDAGDVRAACGTLEESQRLDAGGGTVLLLGICRMREGRTATAWTTLKTALSMARRAGREDRVKLATQAMQELSPRLSYLSLALDPGEVARGISIHLDGVPLSPAAWNATFMVDPGEHTLLVTRPGSEPRSIGVPVQEAERLRIDVPLPSGEQLALPGPAAPAAQMSEPAAASPAEAPVADAGSDSWLRAGPWLVGALGAATIGASVLLEMRAWDRHAEAQRQTSAPDAEASAAAAQNWESAAVVTLLSGTLLLGAGITWGVLRQQPARGAEARGGAQVRLGLGRFEVRAVF